MDPFSRQRNGMVERQIAARGVADAHVLEAMRRVPRERFVKPGFEEFAYEDMPLPIEEGQTISQPYVVALMVEAAEVKPGERVLEIGTGSGYAAAVLSQIAGHVYTIERQRALAETAESRFAALGYRNVSVRHADGTEGWPEAAPFDAIIVSAGGPKVPEALRSQLALGGRLIIPIGTHRRDQQLIKLVRRGAAEFVEQDLGGVAFVPLIGKHGWADDESNSSRNSSRGTPHCVAAPSLADVVRKAAEPLPDIADDAFAEAFDRFAEARVVLLGEATHGTSEFYRARAAITRRLIERHGFTIIAVEADWPDAAAINRYVTHRSAPRATERAFSRFPIWMWRNLEVDEFVGWLRTHNACVTDPARQAGFYGLDLYNLNGSIRAVLDYLDQVDPEAARVARERYGCLTRWQKDPATYGRAVLSSGYAVCEKPVIAMLRELLQKRLEYAAEDSEGFLDVAQNARLIAAAEQYYRVMYYGARESWNLRDQHMFDTLLRILEARGPHAKAVVWAHNSHIGNAGATEMGKVRGEHNIGQLCRERFGANAALIGFGTDHGTVAAASDWDEPMEIKDIRPAHRDSYERVCHEAALPCFLLDLRGETHAELRKALLAPRLERAIGVIYRPATELLSHYFDAVLPEQFDAWVWFDETHAVTPLAAAQREGVPETYPFGV